MHLRVSQKFSYRHNFGYITGKLYFGYITGKLYFGYITGKLYFGYITGQLYFGYITGKIYFGVYVKLTDINICTKFHFSTEFRTWFVYRCASNQPYIVFAHENGGWSL